MTANRNLDRLVALVAALDAPQNRFALLERYYRGNSPTLAYLSAEAARNLSKVSVLSANLCRMAVLSTSERLRVSGLGNPQAWQLWLDSNLDQLSATVHDDALLYGQTFVLAWKDSRGRPRAWVESPKTVAIDRDPVTRDIRSAVKRVVTKDSTEVWVYLPDEVQRWTAPNTGATADSLTLAGSVANPLGRVPVVPIGGDDDDSVISDLIPIQDALTKISTDLMFASEAAGRPQRFASGIEAIEVDVLDADGVPTGEVQVVNPLSENGLRTWLAEDPASRFGQLESGSLSSFESAVKVIMAQAMTVTGLPASYFGALHDSVTSADGIRAAESALVARVEAKQRTYGTGHEEVARLLVAIGDGSDPDDVAVKAAWAPADTRSAAQESDAAVKLFQSGILSRRATLQRLGFSSDEVDAELAAVDQDAAKARDIVVGRYMSGQTDQ